MKYSEMKMRALCCKSLFAFFSILKSKNQKSTQKPCVIFQNPK